MAASGSVHGDGEVDLVEADEVGGQAGEGWSDLDGEETATGQEIVGSRPPTSPSKAGSLKQAPFIGRYLGRSIPPSPNLAQKAAIV